MGKKKHAIFMIIIGLICFLYSLYKIVTYSIDTKETNTIVEEMHEDIVEEVTHEEKKYNIDFDNLKRKNSDTVAYLKVNNTNIDYVVVKTNNNKYYLSHNFNKKGSSSGWIFMDYHNKLDGTDKNIVIYGHSMLNKTMFGSLHNVVKPSWYKNSDNHKIVFVSEQGEFVYQVFSVYKIKVEDYYINTEFKSENEFYKFINKLKNRSKYDFGVEVSSSDTILTLSTCGNGGSTRTVLHAKLIRE